MAVLTGLGLTIVAGEFTWMRWELPASTLGELTAKVVRDHYRTLAHPYVRNNLGEMRDIVLAGLAACGAEAVEVDSSELYDGTKLER